MASAESQLLAAERKKSESHFDTRALTCRVWGGEENVLLRERAIQGMACLLLLMHDTFSRRFRDPFANQLGS